MVTFCFENCKTTLILNKNFMLNDTYSETDGVVRGPTIQHIHDYFLKTLHWDAPYP